MKTVFELADWFLSKESMTPKKLQKLVYYAYAWGLALLDEEIVEDPKFEAWVHGPVSQELYQAYKHFGWTHIPKNDNYESNFSTEQEDLLESVWLTYGDLSANELEALTHRELPWLAARGGCSPYAICTNVINPGTMKTYYQSVYVANQGE